MIWTDSDGGETMEWFYYYPPEKSWRRLFVSDNGTAKMREMISESERKVCFVGKVSGADSKSYLDRSTVTVLPGGEIHPVLERSRDEGKT